MNVRVHIERLVLDGLPLASGDAGRLRAAVERELSQQLAQGGLAAELLSGGALPEVAAPAFSLGQHTTAAAPAPESALDAGRQIGRSIYGGIGRQP